jgi:DNA repair photolyase
VPFEWTINPYRGCEFGCKYCYARYTHEFMELRDPRQFEEQIFAKLWSEPAFRAELRRVPRHQPIAIGSATDPYQPAERRFGVTRKILEVFAGDRGRRVWITTKSDLVTRDLDLLTRIAAANQVHVNLTITTLDEKLARLLEPYAPRPALRIAAIARLAEAGIQCGVLCCPVLPLINDSESSLDSLARAAAGAGASWLHGHPLFLKPCSKKVFLPFIEEHFPQLASRYRARFQRAESPPSGYADLIARRLEAVCRRYSLNQRATCHAPEEFSEQLGFYFTLDTLPARE